jgi:hypothetical protein
MDLDNMEALAEGLDDTHIDQGGPWYPELLHNKKQLLLAYWKGGQLSTKLWYAGNKTARICSLLGGQVPKKIPG